MLIVDAISNFEIGGLYSYIDRFGKCKTIHITRRRGRYIEYADNLGVRHWSKSYFDEDISEYLYLGRTGIRVDSFDLFDFA